MHLLLAMGLILSIMLSLLASIVLYDAVSMSVRSRQPDIKAVLSWSATLAMCIFTSVVSWLLVPGSKLYLAVYFAPALLLISMIAIASTRDWIGVPIMVSLLTCWLLFGGFLSSLMVYAPDKADNAPIIYKNYDDCRQVRLGPDLVWRCYGEIN